MLNMKRAASRSEIERLKLIADDTTKSLKERTDAATKAYDMEINFSRKALILAERNWQIFLGK